MKRIKAIKISLFLCSLYLLGVTNCGRDSQKQKVDLDRVIAIVDQDTLYVDDYIRRCEYTVRPDYCQKSGHHDKNICLNSLIAEKLFALEAGQENQLFRNTKFQAFLQGIKEQTMRESLFRDEIMAEIKVSDKEIQQAYVNSLKVINTEAIFVPDQCDIKAVYREAQAGMSFDKLGKKYPGISKKITKDVQWGHIDEDAQDAIFSEKIKSGSVVPPLKAPGGYRLIKVTGWTENVEFSEANRNQEMDNIKHRLEDYYFQKSYKAYLQNFMKGKRIDFEENSWSFMVAVLQTHYLSEEEQKKLAQKTPAFKELHDQIQKRGQEPFMKVDGKVWTILDFNNAIQIHPLELNPKELTVVNFPHKLQAAIASLVTDQYLTERAYKKNYQKSALVNRTVKEWRTSLSFVYHRDKYLEKSGFDGKITQDYFNAFDNYLTPYFEELKKKYDNKIFFNHEVMKDIELTHVPMIAHKTKGPYLMVVPPFPLVTNSVKTNYKRFEKNETK